MKFDYFRLPLPERSPVFGTYLPKPIIPVGLINDKNTISYAALIDSGADFCIFDTEIGEILGLDVDSGTPLSFGGIQDARPGHAFLHEIEVEIGGWKQTTIIGFSDDIAKHGYGILGQRGFFDKFTVKFDLKKEEIELTPKKIFPLHSG